jgi:Flp pilus assembly protein TadD
VSLLHDAIKAKQRERAARPQPESQQPVLDGFLPYVSTSSTRAGSKRAQIAVIGAAVVVLVVTSAWLAWPRDRKAPRAGRPPIILPPPVTVSQRRPVVDSSKSSTVETQVASPDAQTPDALPVDSRATSAPTTRNPQRSARREIAALPRVASADVVERTDVAGASEPVPIRAPAVDYEAQATALFNAGDLEGARDRFERATRVAPSARVWTNYGVTLHRLGDLRGASAAYRSAIGMDASYLEAWLYQGRIAAEQGETGRAIPLFQRALAINPLNADVNVELARLEYEARNWTESRRFAENALRGDATSIRANWYLGVAGDTLKDVDAAIRGYSGFLRYVGDTPDQARFVGWARTRLAELRGKP